ncbi:TonB-dependent receptor [Proteobacteria bacterium 005FR1]|nr:TonB-dependent receptor [Proteobacteria bacterium 005FR1]
MNNNIIRGQLSVSLLCLAALGSLPSLSMAQDGAGIIEEVVVTARKRAENLQDVPVAVSAFNAAELQRQGVNDITELQQRLPNTTLQVSRGTNSTLTAYIRGIGQQDPLWGFEPGVGIYIDDVYIARPQGAVLDILDVENIEVLRGPQGTLYGKNTIGGALKYQTRQLDNEASFQIRGRAGSYNQRDIVISGSTPLIENTLYIGGGIASLQRDGFGEFRNTGDDNYNKEVQSAHLKLEWQATDDVLVRISADETQDDSNPRGGYRLTPSLVTGQRPYGSVYDSDSSLPVENEVNTEGASLHVVWDINDQLEFKSITSSREGYTYTNIDFDATAVNTFDVPAIYDDEQFTQEFQLNYVAGEMSVVGGLYYFSGEACGVFDVILGLAGITAENGGCVDTDSYSAYAQATYDFSPAFSMSLGGRYTTDEKVADVYRYVYLGAVYPEQNVTPLLVQSDFTDKEDWAEFSPHIGAQYRFSDDVMAYGSFTSGFKSGGFDMRANQSVNPLADEPFDPEIVDSFEVGLKSSLLDSRLRLNAALFYNDYQDMQVTVQRAVGTTDYASQVVNAGEAKMKGFELEAAAALTDNLSLSAVVGYIDAEFVEVSNFDPVVGRVVDVSDAWVISNTPEWSGNLALNYRADIGAWQSDWKLGASYRDSVHIFELPSALDEGSYTLMNADIVFTSPDSHWMIGLHGKNLTDEEYRIAGYNFAATFDSSGNLVAPGLGGEDTVTGFYGDPRTVMLSVGYQF